MYVARFLWWKLWWKLNPRDSRAKSNRRETGVERHGPVERILVVISECTIAGLDFDDKNAVGLTDAEKYSVEFRVSTTEGVGLTWKERRVKGAGQIVATVVWHPSRSEPTGWRDFRWHNDSQLLESYELKINKRRGGTYQVGISSCRQGVVGIPLGMMQYFEK
jgi:hypothetical protein